MVQTAKTISQSDHSNLLHKFQGNHKYSTILFLFPVDILMMLTAVINGYKVHYKKIVFIHLLYLAIVLLFIVLLLHLMTTP